MTPEQLAELRRLLAETSLHGARRQRWDDYYCMEMVPSDAAAAAALLNHADALLAADERAAAAEARADRLAEALEALEAALETMHTGLVALNTHHRDGNCNA